MAHDDTAVWPEVKFDFELSFEGAVQGAFQSASGIEKPGGGSAARVELTKGALSPASTVEAWMAAPEPREVSIVLRDEAGGAAMTWRLAKTRPVDLVFATGVGALADTKLVERLTLACEGFEQDPA
ncbi:MAG: hypothetical protein JSR45_03410 [Proteobacteria bacterium]|nr:hypothetical protein [Pseudomonadota bacterium]